MMQAFRNSGKVVAVFFAAMLLLWLVDLSGISQGTGLFSSTAVGKINGRAIDTRAFETRVRQVTDNQQRQSAAPLSLEDQKQIEDQVWEEFLSTAILKNQYRKHNLSVSDDEVLEAVRNNPPDEFLKAPEFQTDGKFDMGKYQQWLTSSAATPYVDGIAAQYRDILLRNKLLRIVTADIVPSDAALWERYRDEHEQVRIALTAIVPRNVVSDSAVTVSPADVSAYYRAHESDFGRPATAYLSFVSLSRVPTAADTAAALERARKIHAEIAGGAPFAEVAQRESSDTVSGKNGGDLGEWTRGQFDPAFDSVSFSMPLNTLSQPVLSSFGYHLIEVTSRKGAKATGRHILIPIEVHGAHRDLLDAQADTLDRLTGNQADGTLLDTVARTLKLPIGHTMPIQQGSRAQAGRMVVPDAGVWAFQGAKPGQLSSVIETPDAFYVFRLDSLQPAGVPPLEQIRPSVEFAVRDEKKRVQARQIAADFMKRLSEGSTGEQAAAALNLAHKEFGPFTRISPPLDIPQLVGVSFGLDSGQRSGVIDVKDGLYVIRNLQHIKPDSAAFAKELDDFRAQAIRDEREQRVRNFLSALRKQATVVDNRTRVLHQGAAQGQQPLPG